MAHIGCLIYLSFAVKPKNVWDRNIYISLVTSMVAYKLGCTASDAVNSFAAYARLGSPPYLVTVSLRPGVMASTTVTEQI